MELIITIAFEQSGESFPVIPTLGILLMCVRSVLDTYSLWFDINNMRCVCVNFLSN